MKPNQANAPQKAPASTSASASAPARPQPFVDPMAAVVTRNVYYRDGFRNLLMISIFGSIAILGLVIAIIAFINLHQPRDRYFATTSDGRLIMMVPLDQANMREAALLSWVSQASTEVMTFGFHDYKRRLQDASRHFTRSGWESFTTALGQSRIIEAVEANKQVVTTAPRSAPIVLQEAVTKQGQRYWRVKLPLAITYQAGDKARTDLMTVELTVVRVPTLENPVGVGINQWIGIQG